MGVTVSLHAYISEEEDTPVAGARWEFREPPGPGVDYNGQTWDGTLIASGTLDGSGLYIDTIDAEPFESFYLAIWKNGYRSVETEDTKAVFLFDFSDDLIAFQVSTAFHGNGGIILVAGEEEPVPPSPARLTRETPVEGPEISAPLPPLVIEDDDTYELQRSSSDDNEWILVGGGKPFIVLDGYVVGDMPFVAPLDALALAHGATGGDLASLAAPNMIGDGGIGAPPLNVQRPSPGDQ